MSEKPRVPVAAPAPFHLVLSEHSFLHAVKTNVIPIKSDRFPTFICVYMSEKRSKIQETEGIRREKRGKKVDHGSGGY